MKTLPTRWDLIRRLKGKRVLDIGGIGYCEVEPRLSLFRNAWAGLDRTTLDMSSRANIVCDLDKLPLPMFPVGFDIVTMFDCLEHLKHPALVLEWIDCNELWLNFPLATSFYTQYVESELYKLEMAKKIENSFHLFGFKPILTKPLLDKCGWTVSEFHYTFDYQSWKGKLLSHIAKCAPYFLCQGFFMRCLKK